MVLQIAKDCVLSKLGFQAIHSSLDFDCVFYKFRKFGELFEAVVTESDLFLEISVVVKGEVGKVVRSGSSKSFLDANI